jgi:hypothetical protein
LHDFKGYVNNVKTVFPDYPTIYYPDYEWVNNDTNDILSSTQVFRLILNVGTGGTGSGTVTSLLTGFNASTSSGDYGLFDSDTSLTIKATPEVGNVFTGWSGGVTSTNQEVNIIMDTNKTITARFDIQYTLTINKDGTGSGTVTTDPANGPFDSGMVVKLTANQTGGSTFAGWSSNVTSTGALTGTITMDNIKSVTATFNLPAPIQYILTTGTDGTGSGTVEVTKEGSLQQKGPNGYAPFDINTKVTVKAIPTGESIFAGWSGATLSKENSVNITMDDNKTVTAKFLANPSSSVPYAQYNCPVILY